MTPDDISKVRDFYESAYALYGDDARSVRWADAEVQQLRFEVLSHIIPPEALSAPSVLDVGCGLGDLYKFFLRRQIAVEYTGIDIVPAFIARASELYPDAHFDCKDFSQVAQHYDYIFASGAFSITVPHAKDHYFAAIAALYAVSKRGFAFNMLKSSAYEPDETYTTYDIAEVTAFCKTLCNDVTVVSDYLPWDFTVCMRK